MKIFQKIGLLIALLIVSSCFLWLWKGKSIFYNAIKEHGHQHVIRIIPQDLSFAGEKVHFKTPSSYQLFYRELKLNAASNKHTRTIKKNSKKILPLIEKVLKANNVPDDFKYIAIAESNLRNDVRSRQGAAGVWQFTKSTAQALGLQVNETQDERLNILKSTKAACRYIKMAKKKFGNWTSAAAAYNRGMGGLERALAKQETNSYYDLDLNSETEKYLYKILAFKKLFKG